MRAKILERENNRCLQCGKKDREVLVVVRDGSGRWSREGVAWYDGHGRPCDEPVNRTIHKIRVVLTVAHLDHNPPNLDPTNLRALCQHCHLKYDYWSHRQQIRLMREAKAQQINMFEPMSEGNKEVAL